MVINLFNPTPVFSCNDQVNTTSINSVFFGERRTSSVFFNVSRLYVSDFFFSKNMVRMGFSVKFRWCAARVVSAFRYAIDFVVAVCTDKQMFRPNTRWVVAFMANQKSGGDFPIGELPGCSVGIQRKSSCIKVAVTEFILKRCPYPAIPAFINLTPESIHARLVAQNGGTY